MTDMFEDKNVYHIDGASGRRYGVRPDGTSFWTDDWSAPDNMPRNFEANYPQPAPPVVLPYPASVKVTHQMNSGPPQQYASAFAEPVKKTHKLRNTLLVVLGLMVVLIVGSALSGGDKGTTPSATTTAKKSAAVAKPTSVIVSRFVNDFDENQVAAEAKWGGKYVSTKAEITNINTGVVSFANVGTEISLTQIACKLKNEDQVLKLKKGQTVTFRGIVGDSQTFGVIEFKDCIIG